MIFFNLYFLVFIFLYKVKITSSTTSSLAFHSNWQPSPWKISSEIVQEASSSNFSGKYADFLELSLNSDSFCIGDELELAFSSQNISLDQLEELKIAYLPTNEEKLNQNLHPYLISIKDFFQESISNSSPFSPSATNSSIILENCMINSSSSDLEACLSSPPHIPLSLSSYGAILCEDPTLFCRVKQEGQTSFDPLQNLITINFNRETNQPELLLAWKGKPSLNIQPELQDPLESYRWLNKGKSLELKISSRDSEVFKKNIIEYQEKLQEWQQYQEKLQKMKDSIEKIGDLTETLEEVPYPTNLASIKLTNFEEDYSYKLSLKSKFKLKQAGSFSFFITVSQENENLNSIIDNSNLILSNFLKFRVNSCQKIENLSPFLPSFSTSGENFILSQSFHTNNEELISSSLSSPFNLSPSPDFYLEDLFPVGGNSPSLYVGTTEGSSLGIWSLSFWIKLVEAPTGQPRLILYSKSSIKNKNDENFDYLSSIFPSLSYSPQRILTPSIYLNEKSNKIMISVSTMDQNQLIFSSNNELEINKWTFLTFVFNNLNSAPKIENQFENSLISFSTNNNLNLQKKKVSLKSNQNKKKSYHVAIYFDGILDIEATYHSPIIRDPLAKLIFFKSDDLDGPVSFIKNFSIWKGSLNPDEVFELYLRNNEDNIKTINNKIFPSFNIIFSTFSPFFSTISNQFFFIRSSEEQIQSNFLTIPLKYQKFNKEFYKKLNDNNLKIIKDCQKLKFTYRLNYYKKNFLYYFHLESLFLWSNLNLFGYESSEIKCGFDSNEPAEILYGSFSSFYDMKFVNYKYQEELEIENEIDKDFEDEINLRKKEVEIEENEREIEVEDSINIDFNSLSLTRSLIGYFYSLEYGHLSSLKMINFLFKHGFGSEFYSFLLEKILINEKNLLNKKKVLFIEVKKFKVPGVYGFNLPLEVNKEKMSEVREEIEMNFSSPLWSYIRIILSHCYSILDSSTPSTSASLLCFYLDNIINQENKKYFENYLLENYLELNKAEDIFYSINLLLYNRINDPEIGVMLSLSNQIKSNQDINFISSQFLLPSLTYASNYFDQVGSVPENSADRLSEEFEVLPFLKASQGQTGEEDDSLNYYRLTAQEGNVNSMVEMGRLSYYGSRGMPQDQSKALAYYILAARQGDPGSACSVGKMIMKGEGLSDLHLYMKNNDIDPSSFSFSLNQLNSRSNSSPINLTNEQRFEIALLWILRSIELSNGVDSSLLNDSEFDNDDEEDLLPFFELIYNTTKIEIERNYNLLSIDNIKKNNKNLEMEYLSDSENIESDNDENIFFIDEVNLNNKNIENLSKKISDKFLLNNKNKLYINFLLPKNTNFQSNSNQLVNLNANICSLNCLGYLFYYSTSKYIVKNNQKSFQFFLLASKLILIKKKLFVNEGFDSDSIFNIAYCYEEGIGTKVNKKKAIKYYNYGAIYGGHFKSIKNLGEKSLQVSYIFKLLVTFLFSLTNYNLNYF